MVANGGPTANNGIKTINKLSIENKEGMHAHAFFVYFLHPISNNEASIC
jgi:hypothetical protein